jgi:hypothetical protein
LVDFRVVRVIYLFTVLCACLLADLARHWFRPWYTGTIGTSDAGDAQALYDVCWYTTCVDVCSLKCWVVLLVMGVC